MDIFSVSDVECSNLIRRLGLDQRPNVHVVGVQICPNGRGVIYLTLKKEVEIEKYCRYDVLDVTASGIRAILAKPAGKRDVVITLQGVHPNTTDNTVLEYLAKFSKVMTNKVIYGVFSEGPLKGMRNGDRSYKVELPAGSIIGSYHILDGQRVLLKYPGQQQTCARCLRSAQFCKGKGVARKCEAEGGEKANFNEHILNLWKQIGYSPTAESGHERENSENLDIVDKQEGGEFTPIKVTSDTSKFTGVVIKNIPADVDHGEVVEFLIKSGVPSAQKDSISTIITV